MPFLLRCRLTKYDVSPPGKGGPHARAMSPAPVRLELDHLGPEVGEHRGAERAGQGVAQVEHLHVFERHPHQRPPVTARVWPVM